MSTLLSNLAVNLGARSYPIYIGVGIHRQAELYQKHITGDQVLVVSNKTVAPLYLQSTLEALEKFNAQSVILPDGEEYKTLDGLNQILLGCWRNVSIELVL